MRPTSPLGSPLERIRLPDAPIERVVAQVRFPAILRIAETSFVATFQESIRKDYPNYEREESRNVQIRPDGVEVGESIVTHRFQSVDGRFRVSLAPTFMALEQRGYDKREVFFGQLASVTESLVEMFDPAVFTRFGIRYIDRITGAALSKVEELISPELLGSLMHFELGKTLRRSITEIEVQQDGAELKARWGYFPKGDAFPTGPTEEPSFLLDVDGYTRESAPLTVESLMELSQQLTDMIYRFFRWSVTDEFLKHYGAEL